MRINKNYTFFDNEKAFNFIVQPVTLEKLNTILSKASVYLNLLKTKFYYKYNNTENGIDCSDILYLESEKRKMHIYTCNGEVFSFYDTVANTYGKLEPILFIRCHASYIVNLKYVKELNRDSITLTDNSIIPVSNRFRDSHTCPAADKAAGALISSIY